MFLNVTSGFNLEGGHDELHGLDANDNLIDVPLHRHAVSLDFTRIEAEVQHTLRDGWDVWLRVPYDVKDQSVSIKLVDPATDAEQQAMERNSWIHHRDDTYQGISDLKLLAASWRRAVFSMLVAPFQWRNGNRCGMIPAHLRGVVPTMPVDSRGLSVKQ